MKKISIVLLALVLFGCLNTKNEDQVIKVITAEEMESVLQLEDVQLVDVRSAEEHTQIRIANSQNIDFNSPTFDEDVAKLDKSKPVVLYCRGGGRSAKCAKKLKEAGFKKIYDLEGGLSKWKHSKKLKLEVKS